MHRSIQLRLSATCVALGAALAIFACSDVTGPSSAPHTPHASIAFNPVFQTDGPAGIVQFERVRVILRRADGSIALDTLIDFPAGASEVQLTLNVPLGASAPPSGEEFSLNLEMLDATGNVVFRGGPVSVRATEGTPLPPVDIPTTYTGLGATAAQVVITPTAMTVLPGTTVDFSATAFDAGGAELPGTPVQWTSLDPGVATVPDPTVGRAVAGSVRGTARIRATLVTGHTAEGVITIRPAASAMALDGGNNQTGSVGAPLPAPLSVKVTATDGLGIDGTVVSFAIVSGGGTLSTAQATTGADGVASVVYTVGSTPGTATIVATVDGLPGSPVSFTVNGAPGVATQLVFTTQPVNGVAGSTLPAIAVQALDAFGNAATAYAGTITLALEAPPAGVVLQGTLSATAVSGVATFSDVRVSSAATALRLRASGSAIAATVLSTPFDISAAPATQLVLTVPPAETRTGRPMHLTLEARNALGGVATQYTGPVTITVADGPAGAGFSGGAIVPFVNGVANTDLVFMVVGQYQLIFTAPGLPQVLTATFNIVAGQPATLEIVSGDNQAGAAGAPLPLALVVKALDAAGDPIIGGTVAWTVTAGGGSVSPPTSLSDATGVATAGWTLGTTGTQTVTATMSGVTATFNATFSVGGPVLRTWIGNISADWFDANNWSPAAVPGPTENVAIGVGEFIPVLNAPATINNLTMLASSVLLLEFTELTVTGNVSLGAGSFIDVSFGPVLLTASIRAGAGNPRQRGGLAESRRVQRMGMLASAVSEYGTIIMTGGAAGATITQDPEASIFVDVAVTGTVSAASDLFFGQSLYVSMNAGLFNVGANRVGVNVEFATFFGGRVTMTQPSSILEVFGYAVFAGGSTAGAMTAGNLILHYGFEQITSFLLTETGGIAASRSAMRAAPASGGVPPRRLRTTKPAVMQKLGPMARIMEDGTPVPTSFAPSGTHVTTFRCTDIEFCGTGYIYFQSPVESAFRNVVFDGGYWIVEAGMRVLGNMSLINGATVADYYYYGLLASAKTTGAIRATLEAKRSTQLRVLGEERQRTAASASASVRAGAPRGTAQARRAPSQMTPAGLAASYGASCSGRLCVDGNIIGDATTSLVMYRIDLLGAIVGSIYIEAYEFVFAGTNQVISSITNPGLNIYYLRVRGTAALVDGETFAAYYGASVLGTGVLNINGGRLEIPYYGYFETYDAGVVIMDDAAAYINTGDVYFFGGTSTLTAGEIYVGGSFYQGATAESFAASGTHTVAFGCVECFHGINFLTPGLGAGTSHFANVEFNNTAAISVNTNVVAAGTMTVPDDIGTLGFYGTGTQWSVEGMNAGGGGTTLIFSNTMLRIGATGPLTKLNSAFFTDFLSTPAIAQLTLSRNDGTYSFSDIVFTTSCANTFQFIYAQDTDASGPAPAFTFGNSGMSDPNCFEKIVTDGRATVIGLIPQ